ncbi:hypothetical protein JS533_003750 [Bifidobacterium amazonense]|uniref:Uncharacterized protein n=1 Tax=Bifidobacterium amazonense TaxID=2809027 RepID=A0ABS9VTU3_9BIFI|nr:hypothetical protein [Bifidobacterium amazonense]MCH9275391.1 hypothetical protein [Bifidobacterium amazonense]
MNPTIKHDPRGGGSDASPGAMPDVTLGATPQSAEHTASGHPIVSDRPVTDRRPIASRRPMWWWLLAAFLALAVIVTGAFVWQRATRMSAQRIYDELVSLDQRVTVDQLVGQGYVYGGRAEYGEYGRIVLDDEFPRYVTADPARIDRFMDDVRAGRESVLRLVVRGVGPSRAVGDSAGDANGGTAGSGDTVGYGDAGASGDAAESGGAAISGNVAEAGVSVRILWFDPNVSADWAEKDDPRQPAVIHHDGKGQIREWWWRDGEIVTSDKRFSRGIQRDDSSGSRSYVLKHQPAIPADPDSTDTVITPYDENLYQLGGD